MKKEQSSVTSLLMVCAVAATLIYSMVFGMLAYTQVDNTLNILHDKILNEQAQQISDSLSSKTGPDNTQGYQYIVHDVATGRVVMHSPGAHIKNFPLQNPDPGAREAFSFFGPQGMRYVGFSIRQTAGAHDYVISIAQSDESIKTHAAILSGTFFQRMSLLGIPFLFILLLVIAMGIKLIMSPLTKALTEAQEISFATPGVRLNAATFPQEIKPLALAINAALDRLERGIAAQKDFIANAAHELRTPISILRLHVDLLEDKGVAAKMRDDVDAMGRLVGQLLDTARLESPERLDMHPVDLAAVVRAASEAIWPLMVKDDRVFEVEGIDDPVMVDGHFDVLCRALRNLLENALKYSPRGTPIALTLRGRTITVRDHGAGIPPQDLDRIFEKFARKDMQQGVGAGLGLFIVRRTMELHGGTATAQNARDGGSIFILEFPQGMVAVEGLEPPTQGL